MKLNWAEITSAIFGIMFAHTASVRLGNGVLSASVASGAPTHLTVAQVIASITMCFAGVPASIQSGDVTLTYTPNAVAALAASPAPPTSA